MNEARQVGRRTKCNAALTERAADLLKLGLSDTDAIEMLPIGRSAFYGWIQRGEAEAERLEQPGTRRRKREAPFVSFSDRIKGAKAARIEALLARIWDAASGRGKSTETRCTYDGEGRLTARIVTEKAQAPTWQAAAWLLERLHHETYSQHRQVDVADWRAEARAIGIEDPEALFEDLVGRYQTAIEETAYA